MPYYSSYDDDLYERSIRRQAEEARRRADEVRKLLYVDGGPRHVRFKPDRTQELHNIARDLVHTFLKSMGYDVYPNDQLPSGTRIADRAAFIAEHKEQTLIVDVAAVPNEDWQHVHTALDVPLARCTALEQFGPDYYSYWAVKEDKSEFVITAGKWMKLAKGQPQFMGWIGDGQIVEPTSTTYAMPVHGCIKYARYRWSEVSAGMESERLLRIPHKYLKHLQWDADKRLYKVLQEGLEK